MVVAVFADPHAHAEALEAVLGAAEASGAEELWSLGDMIGRGPDPEHVVARTRERCSVALMGNHDYGATGSAEPTRFGEPGSPAVRSIELAGERLSGDDVDWMRSRKPAARRGAVQCWHGGPHNAVHEYVGASNAAACLATQRAELGLVGHTHVAAAWLQTARGAREARVRVGVPLELAGREVAAEPGSGRRAGADAARLVGRAWMPRRPTARTGCCSTWSGGGRPGAASPMTRVRRGCERERWASTNRASVARSGTRRATRADRASRHRRLSTSGEDGGRVVGASLEAMTAVEAQGLVKHYPSKGGAVEAVRGVDLRVDAGEVFGFLGPERGGEVDDREDAHDAALDHRGHAPAWPGVDVAGDPDAVRHRIGVALQEAGLDPRQTGRELIVLQARLFGLSAAEAQPRAPRSCSRSSSSRTPPTARSRATRAA